MSKENYKNRTRYSLGSNKPPKIMREISNNFKDMKSPEFQENTDIKISKIYFSNFRPKEKNIPPIVLQGYFPSKSCYRMIVTNQGFSIDFDFEVKQKDSLKLEKILSEFLLEA